MGYSSCFFRLYANFVKSQSTSAQALLSLDSMNFHRSATALVLVAMALTSCKSPSSDSSESAPPAEETIPTTKACNEAKPLIDQIGDLMGPIAKNVVNDEPTDDNVARLNSVLDEFDAIADSGVTEEVRASFLSYTESVDKLVEKFINRENPDEALAEFEGATEALIGECL